MDDVRVGLQRRPGVYYVSLEDWDTSRNVARYEVLCRYDVQRFLPTYVDELRAGRVHVLAVKQRGDEIRALARRFPPLRD